MTLDFHTNKKILEEVAIIPSKRLRNKIAGFSTHLMKRIQKGPVRGISLKLQEEERERRMDFVPDESAIKINEIKVDKETLDMLAAFGMSDIPGLVEVEPQAMNLPQAFGRGAVKSEISESQFGVFDETGALRQSHLHPFCSSNDLQSLHLEDMFEKTRMEVEKGKKRKVRVVFNSSFRKRIGDFSTNNMTIEVIGKN
ncbi:40S ribosomal protein S17-3, partial [Cucurbita argyrosperma subsp. sororia]